MSDVAETSAHPGSISPRNVDTRFYRVLQELPITLAPVGGEFSAWPQGEVFACVSGIGLGVVKNSDIAAWVKEGRIEHLTDAPGVAERKPSDGGKASPGIRQPKTQTPHSAVTRGRGSRPWTLPGAENEKG